MTNAAGGCGAGGLVYGADDDDGLGAFTTNNFVNVEWLAGGPNKNVFIGTSADETFEGGNDVDVILGQGGSDSIYGFVDGGADAVKVDILCGGDGDDTITGGGAATVAGEGQMRTATGSNTNVLLSQNGLGGAQDPQTCLGLAQTYSVDKSGQNICFGATAYASCINN